MDLKRRAFAEPDLEVVRQPAITIDPNHPPPLPNFLLLSSSSIIARSSFFSHTAFRRPALSLVSLSLILIEVWRLLRSICPSLVERRLI